MATEESSIAFIWLLMLSYAATAPAMYYDLCVRLIGFRLLQMAYHRSETVL